MPSILGAHRGTPAAAARAAQAPARLRQRALGGDQTARPYDQGELLAQTSVRFRAQWGSGICRVLVAQWLAEGGRLDQTYFAMADAQMRAQRENGDAAGRLATRAGFERLVGGQMDTDRADMLENHGLTLVASLARTSDPNALAAFLVAGGLFYVRLSTDDDTQAHAVGVIIGPDGYRLFDPNTREVGGDVMAIARHLWRVLADWRLKPPYLCRYEAFKVVRG
ncbi:MAG: hypothetical protein KIS83_01185 [Rubrivivax sp.]|nr:hypothetical protein [Rubrivivax sp.]